MQMQSSSKVRWLVISSKRPGIDTQTQEKERNETKIRWPPPRATLGYSVFNTKHDLLPSHNRRQKKNVKRRKQGKRKEEIRRKRQAKYVTRVLKSFLQEMP
jgi:hypothetical protein